MRISIEMHRPAEAVIGFLLIALPWVVDLGAAAMVIAVLMGAILVALAYGGMREGDPVPPATHLGMDRLVTGGIGFAALVAQIQEHGAAALLLALLGVAMAVLTAATRYVGDRPDRATTAGWDDGRRGSARG